MALNCVEINFGACATLDAIALERALRLIFEALNNKRVSAHVVKSCAGNVRGATLVDEIHRARAAAASIAHAAGRCGTWSTASGAGVVHGGIARRTRTGGPAAQ